MNKNKNYSIVLAGGFGTRLWPVSRKAFPKQFTSLLGEETLLQNTNRRLVDMFNENIVYVVGKEHFYNTKNQLDEQGLNRNSVIIAEPVPRNTAPAILLGTLYINSFCDDAVIHVYPSDHLIADTDTLGRNIEDGSRYALEGYLVTYGIKPAYPETGYGYIKEGSRIDNFACKIESFHEKPDIKTASGFVDSGDYYWNSGIFAFRCSDLIEEYRKHCPEIWEVLSGYSGDPDVLTSERFGKLPSISFDEAIMECTDRGVVIRSDFQWSDLGSWKSVYELTDRDENGNYLKGRIITNNTRSCYVRSENRLVVLNDTEKMVVVDTDDALFISPLESSSRIKDIIEAQKDVYEFSNPVYVNKPWGFFVPVLKSDGYGIKRINVRPGARLSLQKHQNRSENWTVVKGRAFVIKGNEQFALEEGETVHIPANTIHRLQNREHSELEVIEIQFGSCIDEEDITRVEDDYGRALKK